MEMLDKYGTLDIKANLMTKLPKKLSRLQSDQSFPDL